MIELPLSPVAALRIMRAIAILERIGTPELRRILEKLFGQWETFAMNRVGNEDTA